MLHKFPHKGKCPYKIFAVILLHSDACITEMTSAAVAKHQRWRANRCWLKAISGCTQHVHYATKSYATQNPQRKPLISRDLLLLLTSLHCIQGSAQQHLSQYSTFVNGVFPVSSSSSSFGFYHSQCHCVSYVMSSGLCSILLWIRVFYLFPWDCFTI